MQDYWVALKRSPRMRHANGVRAHSSSTRTARARRSGSAAVARRGSHSLWTTARLSVIVPALLVEIRCRMDTQHGSGALCSGARRLLTALRGQKFVCGQCPHFSLRIESYWWRIGPDCLRFLAFPVLQGLECGSSPTSGTVFPQVRGPFWASDGVDNVHTQSAGLL
jgi:hypothetical protein